MIELNLSHTVPIVAYEGVNVRVKTTGAIHLLFFQFTKEGSSPEANVVAAVALNSKENWEEIKKLVDSQIEEASKAER